MSSPATLRINTADLLRATPRGLRLLLEVCQPAGTQQEAAPQPRPQRKPSTNQRRREGR